MSPGSPEPMRPLGAVNQVTLEPFYFGDAHRRLFGVYHPPQGGRVKPGGVVLCYPFGQEYIRAHRSFRQLALRLAGAGFPALRFDYYGCGDSAGDREDGTVREWTANVSAAIAEIRRRAGVTRVSLVGLRFGGTLAALAATTQSDVDAVVLWDAVVEGSAYLEELAATQRENVRKAVPQPAGEVFEVLGFPLSMTLLAEVRATSLARSLVPPAARVLVVESQADRQGESLAKALASSVSRVDYRHVPTLPIWIHENKALVPAQILQTIIAWLSEVYQ